MFDRPERQMVIDSFINCCNLIIHSIWIWWTADSKDCMLFFRVSGLQELILTENLLEVWFFLFEIIIILALVLFELVSILFAIVPEYENEYITKENKNWTSFKDVAPKLNLNHNVYTKIPCWFETVSKFLFTGITIDNRKTSQVNASKCR